MARSKVLIVDDETEILTSLSFILNHNNFEVFKAQNGIEGLSILRTSLPDIILLDGNMPLMNGKEFLVTKKSENLGAEIPVIFMSSEDWDLEKSQKISYLPKPFDPNKLLKVIESIIRIEE